MNFCAASIYERSRIHLGPDKRVLVTSRLAKRLRHHGLHNYGDYCDLLRSPAGAEELTFLIDRISTNHTHFFREIKHFDFLREAVIPQWQAVARRTEPFRIWSAASSTRRGGLFHCHSSGGTFRAGGQRPLADRGHGHFHAGFGNRPARDL